MFLSKEEFLSHFPLMHISKQEFSIKFKVMYVYPQSLDEIFSFTIAEKTGRSKPKQILKNELDKRYIARQQILDYFYEIIINNRHMYLEFFY